MRWPGFMKMIKKPVKIHEELDYRKAYQFKRNFQPQDGVEYGWIKQYAEFIYSRLEQASETLDSKAESMIRIFAGGSGLVSLGAILNLSDISVEVAICWLIALGLALVSIYSAARVRFPRQTYLPPSLYWAIQYAEHHKSTAEDRFLAQWHLACEGLRLNNRWKASGLKVSVVFGVAAIVCLALSFCVALGTMKTIETNDSPEEQTMAVDPPPAPDPAAQPQTADSTSQVGPSEHAGPQSVENSYNPNAKGGGGDQADVAGPQSDQDSSGAD